jgi:serine/threonine-protein kinase
VVGRKWRVVERLGAGSSATVYRAKHWNNDVEVAVKVLHPTEARSAATRTRFLREGRLANSIDHTGVVRVLDDGETDDGCPFLVMDLLEGETIEQRRQASPDGRLPVQEAVDVCLAVLEVLAVAHERAIVHRDVKPHHLFVTTSDEIKLLDFGIAGAAESGDTSVTPTAAGLGTLLFMAPEQVDGARPVDSRADLWGVGSTLYYLLSGTFPFERIFPSEYVMAARKAPRRLNELVPEIPVSLRPWPYTRA